MAKRWVFIFAPVLLFNMERLFAQTNKEECSLIASLSEVIMRSKQEGFELEYVLKQLETGYAKIDSIALNLGMEAYETPRYSTKERKKQAVTDFKNNYYVSCLRHISE